MEKFTKHGIERKCDRGEIINKIGLGEVIITIEVDKGHKNGNEIHKITSTGLIIIHNAQTEKYITTLIARPGQIYRYFENRPMPIELYPIIQIAKEHKRLGYNNY